MVFILKLVQTSSACLVYQTLMLATFCFELKTVNPNLGYSHCGSLTGNCSWWCVCKCRRKCHLLHQNLLREKGKAVEDEISQRENIGNN